MKSSHSPQSSDVHTLAVHDDYPTGFRNIFYFYSFNFFFLLLCTDGDVQEKLFGSRQDPEAGVSKTTAIDVFREVCSY